MKYALLIAALGFSVIACRVDASGNDAADDDGKADPAKGSKCDQLAEMCPYCTLPDLETTCRTAVGTRDEESCQNGLDDNNVQRDCVPKTGTGSSSGGSSSGGSSSGGSSSGGSSSGGSSSGSSSGGTGPRVDLGQCLGGGCVQTCAAGQHCEADCAGGNCTQSCSEGATCGFSCSGSNCSQSCAAGSDCSISCSGSNCQQTCGGACDRSCSGGNCT